MQTLAGKKAPRNFNKANFHLWVLNRDEQIMPKLGKPQGSHGMLELWAVK